MTTSAFVVGRRESGEAACVLSLFTRELGLVQATARGIRFHKSKLRYHVQDYAFARVTLTAGHEYWVLIGAVPISYPTPNPSLMIMEGQGRDTRKNLARAGVLLTRFLGEQDPHPEMFDDLVRLTNQDDQNGEEQSDVDILLELAILDRLGYVSHSPATREEARFLIDRAMRESHL